MSLRTYVRRASWLVYYNLFIKRKLRTEQTVRMFGFTLTVPVGVFHPGLFRSSRFLAEYVGTLPLAGKTVVDMGSGCGLLSLVAASLGGNVSAIDINPKAVESTRSNAVRNGFQDRINSIHGDLFGGLNGSVAFDYIIANPPYYQKRAQSLEDRAWAAGEDLGYFEEFSRDAARFLRPGGTIVMVLSSDSNVERILSIFSHHQFKFSVRMTKSFPFERLYIVEGTGNPCTQ